MTGDLDLLYADGAYGGPHSDVALVQQQVTLIQTASVGPKNGRRTAESGDAAPYLSEPSNLELLAA